MNFQCVRYGGELKGLFLEEVTRLFNYNHISVLLKPKMNSMYVGWPILWKQHVPGSLSKEKFC